ncbi:MAG: class I SAM-dependent methyltransferase [Candidatus Micrarchaeaceae archaeon]|jgi:SAM-dependent methyltransferase
MAERTLDKPNIGNAREYWDSAWKSRNLSTTYALQFINYTDLIRKRVLEIGCGDMSFANYLDQLKLHRSYVGVDISASGLKRAEGSLIGGSFVQADARSLPFESKSFDFVMAIQTISSIGSSASLALREASRVLANGGSITFDVIHSDYFAAQPKNVPNLTWADNGRLLRRGPDYENVMCYDPIGIVLLLKKMGLREKEIIVYKGHEFNNLGTTGSVNMRHSGPDDDVNKVILVRASKI